MSLFERILGRKPAPQSPEQPSSQEKTLAAPPVEAGELERRIAEQRVADKAREAEILEGIRGRERAVPTPRPEKVDVLLEGEALRTSEAELQQEQERNRALAERLVILRGLQKEISEVASADSKLAQTRRRQIVAQRAQMIHEIPRYAGANVQNIQETLKRVVEEEKLGQMIELSETEWRDSHEKIKNLQRMTGGSDTASAEMKVNTITERLSLDGTEAATRDAFRGQFGNKK